MARYDLTEFLKLTTGEQSLVKWQYNEHGGFYTTLWKAITIADGWNLARLERGFPEHVQAYRRFASEKDYWPDIQRKLGLLPKKEDGDGDL